jgi:subtilisin family serine protease
MGNPFCSHWRRLGKIASTSSGGLWIETLEERRLLSAAGDLIGVTALRADPALSGINGAGVQVAVIDTGVDQSHAALAGAYVTGYDFVHDDSTPEDEQGHGTHVSGIIAARDPDIGVAMGAGLVDLKVGGAKGSTRINLADVEKALQWVLTNHQQYNILVVNMSLGGGFFTSPDQATDDILYDDVKRLESAGITVVSAAGNEFDEYQQLGSGSPGIFSTLDVGAVWDKNEGGPFPSDPTADFVDFTTGPDRITYFSDRPGTDNVIFAPGALIRSTLPGGTYGSEGGTSQAAPMVSGTVALMQQAASQFGGRYLTPAEVRSIMQANADTINDGDDEDTNVQTTGQDFPRVDAYKAVQGVRAFFQEGAPPPPGQAIGDNNGTLAGAVKVPTLDGNNPYSLGGGIGTDNGQSIGAKDVDLFQLNVVEAGDLTIDLSSPDGSSSFDSYLRVFDADGKQIATNDDQSPGNLFSGLSLHVNPGTYYAGVSGYANTKYNPAVAASGSNGATGGYTIDFTLDTPDPNGLAAGAVSLNVTQKPQLFGGSIGYDNASFDANDRFLSGTTVGASDVDLFRMTIPDNGTLFAEADTPFSSGYVNTLLRFFTVNADGSATPIGSADDAPAPGDSTDHATDSYAALAVARGQTLLVGVSNARNSTYDPMTLAGRSASGAGGFYNLSISFANNDQNGVIARASDTSLPLVSQPGSIGLDGSAAVGDKDVDFYHFRLAGTGIIDVSVAARSSAIDNPVDALLTLFDAQGNVLATIDDLNGSDPRLQFIAQADSDYYVAVSGSGNNNFNPTVSASGTSGATGNYLLSAQLLPLSQSATLSNDSIQDNTPTSIALGQTIAANLGRDEAFVVGQSDIDLYRFVAATSQVITIRAAGDATGQFAGANPFLRLFDSAGHDLAINDNATADTTDSLVRSGVVAGKTYYIGVSGAGAGADHYDALTGAGAVAGSTGDYSLSVTPFHGFLVTGSDVGADPDVQVFDAATGMLDRTIQAYDAGFKGGVRVASADVNGDGMPDIITAPGPGGPPDLRVFDGFTGQPLAGALGSFFAYDPAFLGGTYVAAGDVNGDGKADIVTGVDAGVGPNIKAFSGADGSTLKSFWAYDPAFLGGVRVAVGDVNGDGHGDIITGAGSAAPHVRAFSGTDNALLANYFAYDPGFAGGIYVSAGQVLANGRAQIITGTAIGAPHVKAFDITDPFAPTTVRSFFAYDPAFSGGVRVGADDIDGDGVDDILAASGPGATHIKVFSGVASGELLRSFLLDATATTGAFVAGQA